MKTIYLAGGCFWGLEKYVGLVGASSAPRPAMPTGRRHAKYGDGSGYAEAVKIEYDPEVAPLPFLLGLYFDAIDPTSVTGRATNRRRVPHRIYYTIQPTRRSSRSRSRDCRRGTEPIAIEVARSSDTRRRGLPPGLPRKNPGGYCHIPRKLFEAAAAARPE